MLSGYSWLAQPTASRAWQRRIQYRRKFLLSTLLAYTYSLAFGVFRWKWHTTIRTSWNVVDVVESESKSQPLQ